MKDKDIASSDVVRVTFKNPDYRNGSVLIQTSSEEIKIILIGIMGGRTPATPRGIWALVSSLLQICPGKVYNEKTGNLISDDLKKGIDYLRS